jgi:hypothetical protein
VLDVVAREKQQLTLPVEFDGLRRLVNFVGAFKVLFSSLGQLNVGCERDLMEVVHLSEATNLLLVDGLRS